MGHNNILAPSLLGSYPPWADGGWGDSGFSVCDQCLGYFCMSAMVGLDILNLSNSGNCGKVSLLSVHLCYLFKLLLASYLLPLLCFSVWLAGSCLWRGLYQAAALGRLVF